VEAEWTDGKFYPGLIVTIEKGQYYISFADGDEGWTDEVRELDSTQSKELFFQIRNKKIEWDNYSRHVSNAELATHLATL